MIAKNKRVVMGYNVTDMSLFDWLALPSYGASETFTEAVRRYLQRQDTYKPLAEKVGVHNVLATLVWGVVNTEIDYRHDTDQFKRVDWWCLPTETWNWRRGDCEDTSFLLSSALRLLENFTGKTGLYRCCLGFYFDWQERAYYGHGYVLWWHDHLKKWIVMETTWDWEVSPSMAYIWRPETYIPATIFDHKEVDVMTSKQARQKYGLTDAWYGKHEALIEAMINYITTGERLPVRFMHKKRRPVPEDITLIIPLEGGVSRV